MLSPLILWNCNSSRIPLYATFGNVIGAFVVMELIKMIIPVAIPVPLSLYFDIFDGLIQAYVFVFLTSLFIKEQIEE